MPLDNAKNFAKATVSTGYDASATSIVLSAGGAARMPTVPFNATWWNVTDYSDPSDDPNVEIVRVTAVAGETLTITRAQEGTSATTKNTSGKNYKLIAGLTAKTVNTDLIPVSAAPFVNGRLTLETAVPVSLSDQTAKTTIYFTPYLGNQIGLYSGTAWAALSFSEVSLALGTLTANTNYDVFAYNNAGTLALELSASWTSDIARADALTLQDGVYVKSGAPTRRYLGSFRTVSATTTEDSVVNRFVFNYYNRVPRKLFKEEVTQHTYNGNYRQWNNNPANQVCFLWGQAENALWGTLYHHSNSVAGYCIGAAGLDSTTVAINEANIIYFLPSGGLSSSAGFGVLPVLGYHRLCMLQSTLALSTERFDACSISAMFVC
jgi:hypothetical protein